MFVSSCSFLPRQPRVTQRFLTGQSVEPGGRWQTEHAASGSMATETGPMETINREALQSAVPDQLRSADWTSTALTTHLKAELCVCLTLLY